MLSRTSFLKRRSALCREYAPPIPNIPVCTLAVLDPERQKQFPASDHSRFTWNLNTSGHRAGFTIAKLLSVPIVCVYFTYKDIHQHIQCQSVLLSSSAKPRANFLAVLLSKPHNLLHVFSDISHLVLLHMGMLKHCCSIRKQPGRF